MRASYLSKELKEHVRGCSNCQVSRWGDVYLCWQAAAMEQRENKEEWLR